MHVVFIPGFLGVPQDFMTLAARLPCATAMLSLPGHGCSDAEVDFNNCNEWLTEQLIGLKIKDYVLYGYSLGGRIALNYVCANNIKLKPKGVIIESANIGLANEEQKKARLLNDQQWAQRFALEEMQQVVTDWYQQPIFADLSTEDRQFLIQRRSKQIGAKVAKTLVSLSLAHMPYLIEPLRKLTTPMLYLHGSEDSKYCTIAKKIASLQNPHITIQLLDGAGHNCHLTHATCISQHINNFLNGLK